MKIQQITETAVSKTNRSRNEIGYKNWNEIQRAVRHSSSNPSDPRHSARLTIDGREVVISKQSAEQLFRWLKKNFKTKHERELFDFLTHQRLLGVLDDNQNLTENKIDMNSPDSRSSNQNSYSDEEIERYGPELIQRQRNLDLLASVFGYQNIHRVARALRAGNLKRRLRHNEGTPEERAQYSRAVRILDSMTDESGNIMPHTDTTVYRQK